MDGYHTRIIHFSVSGQLTDVGVLFLHAIRPPIKKEVVIGRGLTEMTDERLTPLTVSTLSSDQIRKAPANRPFPELFTQIPSTYVENGGGDSGDARIYIRGFDQNNAATLLNSQILNNMEDGTVYWWDWSAIRDLASYVQMQRGVAATKFGVPSLGGSMNVLVKATRKEKAGLVSYSTGND